MTAGKQVAIDKECIHHGFLPLEQWLLCGKMTDNPYQKCKLCRHETYRRNYEANKQKIAIRNKKWRDAHPEKIKEYHIQERLRLREMLLAPIAKEDRALFSRKKREAVKRLSHLLIYINEVQREGLKIK